MSSLIVIFDNPMYSAAFLTIDMEEDRSLGILGQEPREERNKKKKKRKRKTSGGREQRKHAR